ncbi:MAG: DUF2804 domain-containing protein [Propionibacteriaceae bacterium]|jgi:hypothetical protein|nr:DUF2804 domain-containing protein [Propionibacteriaceae bacterium]
MLTSVSVVEDGQRHWGRFARTPTNANPAAAFSGPRGVFESFRTKEWVGFSITHRQFFSSLIVQDAKYLISSEWYLYDIAQRDLAQQAANLRAGALRLPTDIMRSEVDFAARGYHLHYQFEDDQIVITIDLARTKAAPAVHGRIRLDPTRAAPPLVVSARLPQGSMYTNKIIFPASGAITVGDQEYVFDPDQDFAILDEHKSHLPYRTTWTWGTFALPVEGGYAGANFAIRPSRPGQEEESCLWTPSAAEPLAAIRFTQQGSDPMSDWTMVSADGRMDVRFSPLGHKEVDRQLGLAEIHYRQWYGLYSGRLRGQDASWEFEGVHGVCEKMDMRA